MKKRGCVLFNNAYELWTKEVLNFKFELYDPTKPLDICQKIDQILMNEISYPNENIVVDENWIEDCMKDINLAKRISDYEKSVIISPNIFDGSKLSMNLKVREYFFIFIFSFSSFKLIYILMIFLFNFGH